MRHFTVFAVIPAVLTLLTASVGAAPASPSLSLTTTGNSVSASWSSVPEATGYTLYYAPYPERTPIRQINMGTRTSFTVELPDDSAFYVAIAAYDALENSPPSNVAHFQIEGGQTGTPASPDIPSEITLVEIPSGRFTMGYYDPLSSTLSASSPLHEVSVSRFRIMPTEVTQRQWREVMGENPSYHSECGDSCPVEGVSWEEVKEFIRRLNIQTGENYRLPSEAEWEYAARADTSTIHWWGYDIDPGRANCDESVCADGYSGTSPVGSFPANPWGLYDTAGNVYEWVEDCWNDSYYGSPPTDGTAWLSGECDLRVVRGGAWNGTSATYLSPKARRYWDEGRRANFIGFRLAQDL